MATPPVFVAGAVLQASEMNAIGLWLVKSQTIGTAVSSVTVTNAFNSDYDNYRIVISGGTASASSNLGFSLSGITGATAYRQLGFFQVYGTATINAYAADSTFLIISQGTTTGYYASFDITSPNLAYPKFVQAIGSGTGTNYVFPGQVTTATASTGFIITPGSGTLTGGTISVYGYRK